MQEKKNDTTSVIGRTVVIVAILLPLIPLYEWGQEAFAVFRASDHLPTLLLYYPARGLALLGFVLMFYQFVLGARLPFMERIFTRVTSIRRHKSLGKLGFTAMFLHGTFMLTFETAMSGQLYLDLPRVIGLAALLLLTVAVIAAWFAKPLKLSRTTWLRIHRLGYLVFPLAFWHAYMLSSTMAVSTAVTVLFYVLLAAYFVILVFRIRVALDSSRK